MSRALLLILVSVAVAMATPSSVFEGWRFDPNTAATSYGLIYNNGIAYTATTSTIYAVNSTNGWPMWNASLLSATGGSFTFGSMQLRNGMVIVQNTQWLTALNANTGAKVWSISANTSSWSSSNQPLFISDTWMYAFISYSGTRAVKISTTNGALWEFYTSTQYYYSAQIANGNVLMINSNYLTLVNGSGVEVFKTYMSYSPDYSYAPPAVWADKLVFVASGSYLYAYNFTDGSMVWRSANSYSGTTRMIQPTMNATGGANVIVVRGYYVMLIDATYGTEVYAPWSGSYTLYVPTFNAAKNYLYCGDYYGRLYGFNMNTMSVLFQNPTQGSDNDTPNVMWVKNTTLYYGIYYTLYAIDSTSGAILTRFRGTNYIYGLAWDADDFGGSLIVLQNGPILSVLLNSGAGAGYTFGGSPDSIPATWNGVMYFASGSVVSAVAYNGSSMWNTTVTGSFNQMKQLAPVFANGNVYFIEDSSSVEKIWVFNAYTGAQLKTIDPTTSCSGITYVDFDASPIVDGDGSSLIFAASAARVWYLKKDFTYACFTTDYTTTVMPSSSTLLIYAYDGYYRYGILKLGMKQAWKAKLDTVDLGATWTSPIYLDGDLYPGDSAGNLFCIGSDLGSKLWKVLLDGSGTGVSVQMTWGFYGNVYAQNNNGKIFGFQEGYLLLNSNHYNRLFSQPTKGSSALGAPAISPDGVMVFANYWGVFAVYYNGTSVFNVTSYGSCSSKGLSVYMGVISVYCDGRVRLLDLYSGNEWLRTQTADQFAAINNTVLMFSGANLYTLSTGTYSLYSAAQLQAQHAPLPPRSLTPSELFEKNKAWIAGVVVGLIAIIIIVLVAKKMCGGAKKETDYVAMQSAGNTGV